MKVIDAVLVEIIIDSNKEAFEMTNSGIYTPTEDETKKGVNFGKVIRKPSHITEDKYEFFAEELNVGDVVFFPTNRSFNYIPQKNEDIKLLFIPLHDIDSFYTPEKAD